MKRVSKKLKLAMLFACALAGCAAAAATYAAKCAQMTPWQRAQEIDFDKGTGSTKFAAAVDAATNGGLAFCACAAAIIAAHKIISGGKQCRKQ